MTTLQTVSTHDPLSAGSVAGRAGSGGFGAESAPGFAGVLDAFTRVEPDETIEQSEEVVPGDDSIGGDEGDTGEESIDSVVSGGEDTEAIDGQVKEVEFSQRINSAGDLARLLTNAASIDLAGLAAGQLGGQGAGVKSDVEPETGDQKSKPTQNPATQRSHDAGLGRSFLHNQSESLPGSVTGGVQVKPVDSVVQTQAPVEAKVAVPSEAQQSVQPSNVQVAQVVQSHALDLNPNARRLDGLRSINEIAGMAGKSRVVSGSESAGKAGAESGGLDLGNRSKGAERILQGKPDADKAMQRQQIMNQVQRGLASIMNTKGGSMKIRLSPEHLGEVNIQLSTKDGHVSVKIDAENAETRNMLKDGLEGLRGAMESRGVQVDELSIAGRQQSEFERLFGDLDREGNRDRQERQHECSGGDEMLAGDDNIGSDEPRGIWTELGLDAIA